MSASTTLARMPYLVTTVMLLPSTLLMTRSPPLTTPTLRLSVSSAMVRASPATRCLSRVCWAR